MDSFFSLFDPSEGNNNKHNNKQKYKPELDTVKKKPDVTKGRRRGRRAAGKNETLPEESSFLCEPDLSTELLVKDVSYIENFIEINKKNDESKSDDNKLNRRNSSRKCRRKKYKVSPCKDLPPATAWPDADVAWNNRATVAKICDGNVGKNVNDLSKEFNDAGDEELGKDLKEYKNNDFKTTDEYNVIDKLEKVILKDNVYLAGDFNTSDLENDFNYSSDDMEEYVDESTTEPDDSGDEVYGSLPPEPRFGNVEYKLQLVSLCERRFQHLVTQLKWRLRSGGGSAVYVLGVRDCGALVGLPARALRSSLVSLRRMAQALGATLTHVTARRVAPHRAVAEVYVRKLPDPKQSVELRVAVMGANEAGKSTLIGVLTQGELDNGRGSARLNMFRHLHEVKSGRTSSLSHEILGFDAQGNVVNYGCSELMTAERIGERSAKLVSFLDLAGHSKYQRTTLHGLTGYSPHFAMLVISATAGITSITEEHISLLTALDLPFFTVISKCELAASAVRGLVARLAELLGPVDKKPLLITDENLARNCVGPQRLILDAIDEDAKVKDEGESEIIPVFRGESEIIPVFPVSCVKGVGLSALHAYLLALTPPQPAPTHRPDDDSVEFQIDEIFHVGDNSGPVVGGLLVKGQLCEGDSVIIGPLEDGSFVPSLVRSIYRNRVSCGAVRAGQCASVGLAGGAAAGGAAGGAPPPRPAGGAGGGAGGAAAGGAAGGAPPPRPAGGAGGGAGGAAAGGAPPPRPAGGAGGGAGGAAAGGAAGGAPPPRPAGGAGGGAGGAAAGGAAGGAPPPRPGAVLLSARARARAAPSFGGCAPGACVGRTEITELIKTTEQNLADKTKHRKNVRRKNKNLLQDAEQSLAKSSDEDELRNIYSDGECVCSDRLMLEDPDDPRGCFYFQASVQVLSHSTAIYPGFQCTVHIGNVRQTAIIEGIMSRNSLLRAEETAPVLFRFVRCPEYLVRGRRLLFTAGLGTRGIGRITQIFPHVP